MLLSSNTNEEISPITREKPQDKTPVSAIGVHHSFTLYSPLLAPQEDKHVWTPSGYVSPATALWRVDMVRELVKDWGLKITRGGPVWVKEEGGGKIVYV